MKQFLTRLGLYWRLIKSLQTGLLLSTGVSGYLSAHTAEHYPVSSLIGLIGSLFLAISGATVLNMWYDRDIDSVMNRTHHRPLADGRVTPAEALRLGLILSVMGVTWAIALRSLYGLVVWAGWFFDVIVYTLWLKRRTCWSIVWGGVAGGMPILAGRVLAVGELDWIGLLLALSILLWIPTHILTFSMRYFDDYQAAGIPTFPSAYGFKVTQAIIALSSLLAAVSIGVAGYIIGVQAGILRLLAVLSVGLLLLSFATLLRPSARIRFGLFKYASFYMLGAMILLSI